MTDWLGYVCEINSVKFPSSNSRRNRVCFGRMNAESQARLYSREPSGPKLEVLGPKLERSEEVLTPLALQLLASLHRRFNPRRLELLAARAKRQAEFDDESADLELPLPGPGGAAAPVPLEPAFLFSRSLLQVAIPELLAQTGTSGRQFANLLIRSHQEISHNDFPDLERAADRSEERRVG